MTKKYLLFSLDDEKSKHLAEVLGNKTCKKIIDFLAEKSEVSEKDIADGLGIPINTVEYNLKKLQKVEIVEKAKNFFWSKKGKKIPMYKLSNKSIVISPGSNLKSKAKNILPVALIGSLASLAIAFFSKTKELSRKENIMLIPKETDSTSGILLQSSSDLAVETYSAIDETSMEYGEFIFSQPDPIWIWFLIGVIFTLILFTAINWRKI